MVVPPRHLRIVQYVVLSAASAVRDSSVPPTRWPPTSPARLRRLMRFPTYPAVPAETPQHVVGRRTAVGLPTPSVLPRSSGSAFIVNMCGLDCDATLSWGPLHRAFRFLGWIIPCHEKCEQQRTK